MDRSSAVSAFFESGELAPWVDGRACDSREAPKIECVDPGLGQAFASFAAASPEVVADAVAAADRAFRLAPWRRSSPSDRAELLRRLVGLVAQHRKALAEVECLDTGKTLAQALGDIAHFSQTLEYYAGLAERLPSRQAIDHERLDSYTYRTGAGVSAIIIPWNFPIVLLGWHLAPALAAGNTVVIKPAEQASLSVLYIARLTAEAGFPPGVVNVAPGDGDAAGAALANDARIARMSFTGSPEVGSLVAQACARHLVPAKLELGGKGAAVVLDGDAAEIAKALVKVITMNAGQVCFTASRWLVRRSIYDAFVEAAAEHMGKVRVGYWSDLKTRMGPVISEAQRARALGIVDRALAAGASALFWKDPDRGEPGYFLHPALLTGPVDNPAADEEIFGPIAYVTPFDSDEEAVSMVHRSPYGLVNSIWSSDVETAKQVAESVVAGTVWLNSHQLLTPGVPYRGVNRSGYGVGSLGSAALEDQLLQVTISGLKQA